MHDLEHAQTGVSFCWWERERKLGPLIDSSPSLAGRDRIQGDGSLARLAADGKIAEIQGGYDGEKVRRNKDSQVEPLEIGFLVSALDRLAGASDPQPPQGVLEPGPFLQISAVPTGRQQAASAS